MDPFTISMLAGTGLGILKGQKDRERENADRKVAAETARWSPWTGMQAQPVQRADQMGSVMQGGLQGAAFGQGLEQRSAYQDWLAKQNVKSAADAQGITADNSPQYRISGGQNAYSNGQPPPMTNLNGLGLQHPYFTMSPNRVG